VVLAPDAALPAAPDIREVKIAVEGAQLSALHLQRPDAKGVVFFLHGNAGNLQNWFVKPAFYRQANFDLFMLDYRGYGKSTGRIASEAQLRADVLAAYNQVAPQYAGRKIVVYGRSLGSGLAAGLSADLANDAKAARPDLTVLVSPYRSLVALAHDVYPFIPRVLIRYPLRTDDSVARIPGPLMLVHGSRDTLIAPSHSEALKALAPKADLVAVPGGGHNDLQNFPAYLEAFRAALDRL
jgi:pimeloyl-ACP methyl ester carboxylesterase